MVDAKDKGTSSRPDAQPEPIVYPGGQTEGDSLDLDAFDEALDDGTLLTIGEAKHLVSALRLERDRSTYFANRGDKASGPDLAEENRKLLESLERHREARQKTLAVVEAARQAAAFIRQAAATYNVPFPASLIDDLEGTSSPETAKPCAATKLVDGLEYVCRAGVAHAGCVSGLHAWQLVDPKDWRALYRACVAQLSALAEIVGNTNGDPEVTIGIVRSLAAMGRERASELVSGAVDAAHAKAFKEGADYHLGLAVGRVRDLWASLDGWCPCRFSDGLERVIAAVLDEPCGGERAKTCTDDKATDSGPPRESGDGSTSGSGADNASQAPETLPCVRCNKVLESVLPESSRRGINQPCRGLAFSSTGHYGSQVFDPFDGSRLEINICDPCLAEVIRSGMVKATGPTAPSLPDASDTLAAAARDALRILDGHGEGCESADIMCDADIRDEDCTCGAKAVRDRLRAALRTGEAGGGGRG